MTVPVLAEHLDLWIASFRGPLVGLFASWGAGWRDAEELAQDVFAEAWLARARFVGDPTQPEAAGAWLRGIAFRLKLAASRGEARRSAAPIESVDPAEPPGVVDERKEWLARAFSKLPPRHQLVLRMHYLEESSAREVAALLGLTPKAVEVRLYHARKALRARVEVEARAAAQGSRR